MWQRIREMPGGIRLFLVYALLILAGVGLSLRFVVDQAIAAPVSLTGVVVMVLLAYTIFTITLVLQRKQAARGLALGTGQPDDPARPVARVQPARHRGDVRRGPGAACCSAGCSEPEVRTYLSEP